MKAEQNKPATTYICPMYPEVQKDRPGKCPKCGNNWILTNKAQQNDAGLTVLLRHVSKEKRLV
jgi:hypothetical protein